MRRWFARISILSLCLAAALAAAQGRGSGLVVRPVTGPLADQTLYTGSHALLVGISNYAHLPAEKQLHYADKDAIALRDLLVRSYGFPPENVTLLLNEDATRARIEEALAALADSNRVGKDDRNLVYVSSHGETVSPATGGDMGFLIPYDAEVDLADSTNPGPYLKTCLRMDTIWSYLTASPAKHTLLIADACYGGLLVKSRQLIERPQPVVLAGLAARRALQVLTAGTQTQEAREDPALGHGYFTFKLLEELHTRAAVPDQVFTASELAAVLKISVGELTKARQLPQFGNHGDTEGDFLFVSTAPVDTEAPRQRSVPTAPPASPARETVVAPKSPDAVYIPPVPTDLINADYCRAQWYVDSVERTSRDTRVTLKIINMSPKNDCSFFSFESAPLTLIGDDRQIYNMRKGTAEKPKDVRSQKVGDGLERWIIQGGRTISVEVEFERLPDGVSRGQIQYLLLANSNSQPVKFSLTNAAQQPRK